MRPKALEIEESVLGLALRDNQACTVMLSELDVTDFSDNYQAVFDGIRSLFNDNAPVDAPSLRNYLNEQELLSQVGSQTPQHLIDSSKGARPDGIDIACKYLKKYTKRRDLIDLCVEYNSKAQDNSEDTEELLAEAGTSFFDLLSDKDDTKETDHTEAAKRTLEEIQSPKEQGIKSGLDLDKITLGFKEKQFIVIAGKTSHGKSALAQNIMLHAAEHFGHVGFVSMEMSRGEIMERVYSNYADVDLTKISERNLSERDISKIKAKEQNISAFEHGFTIIDSGSIQVEKLYATARRLKMQKNTKMLIVDYLQQVFSDGGTREQEVANVSRTLKRIAMDLDMVVIGLSQFNRKASQSHVDRPQLHHLRESGAIEQDANTAILLWNPSVDGKEYFSDDDSEGKWAGQSTHNVVELHVAKNRGGKTGTVKIGFDGAYQRFYNLAAEPKTAIEYLSTN